jgi:hypothetical protein
MLLTTVRWHCPLQVQKTLAVFDSSGDGLIEPCELQRAAELYADSRLMVSRLIKLSVVMLLFMGALLGCIAGLTIAVRCRGKTTHALVLNPPRLACLRFRTLRFFADPLRPKP